MFLVRVERKIIGFRAVAFEKAGKGLSTVHYTKIRRIVDKFLVPVWGWCGGGYKSIFHVREKREKLLICLCPKASQYASFIQ